MKSRKIIGFLVATAGMMTSGFILNGAGRDAQDCSEYFTGYDDMISFVVQGYQTHWKEASPEDSGLCYIYKNESPRSGFVKYDIDGDGTAELLLGDQYENGDYQLYDIFTFDKKTGKMIHLFCGGERDWCTLNGSGVIIETGSNSAFDSSTDCYILRKLKLKKLSPKQPVTQDLLPLNFDKFTNYSQNISHE